MQSVLAEVPSVRMLRCFSILALVAICLSTVAVIKAEVASKEFLVKQKQVYDLLSHVDQPEIEIELYNIGKDYNIAANIGNYKNEAAVKNFLHIYNGGMLPRGEIFSVFYPELLDQAVALFNVFRYAKDFDTLYKTAAWARIYVNEGYFIYAFSVAVTHHPETQYIRLPHVHELYPYLFFNEQIIRYAYNAKLYADPKKNLVAADGSIIIQSNYSYSFPKYWSVDEYKLSYFTEDLSLNNLQYYAHITHPFWLPAKEFGYKFPGRGQLYLWSFRNYLARYNLERLANDLDEIEDFDWNYPIPKGYNPGASYHNGLPLPHRDEDAVIPNYNYKYLSELRDLEYRISAAIDTGFVITRDGKFQSIRSPHGVEILGNLIEGNADSINYDVYGRYEYLARNVLGYSPEPIGKWKVIPSTLQYYDIAQRDLIYWSLLKKIVDWYDKFISYLPSYTYEELAFPQVKIESVEVVEVSTFYDYADYLISSGLKVHGANDKQHIKARQYRLNHKPYSYDIQLHSEREVKAFIRVFLGPKYGYDHLELDFINSYKYFYLLDEWTVNLKAGSNNIKRSSSQSIAAAHDLSSTDFVYKQIQNAIKGDETYEIPEQLYSYPSRTLIPKGRKEGSPFQLFVYIGSVEDKGFYNERNPLFGNREYINITLDYPLDRPISSKFVDLPNVFFTEFDIYHKEGAEVNYV